MFQLLYNDVVRVLKSNEGTLQYQTLKVMFKPPTALQCGVKSESVLCGSHLMHFDFECLILRVCRALRVS